MAFAFLADASQSLPYANYGLAGLMFAVLIVGSQRIYRDVSRRADRAEAEVARLNGVIQDKYVPALEATRQALLESHELNVLLRSELRNRK